MTYLDILSDSISHFTEMPRNFVVDMIKEAMIRKEKGTDLLRTLMEVRLSEAEGRKIISKLKEKNLSNTISFIAGLMNHMKMETERQSMLN